MLGCKVTALVFAEKDVAFCICLIDSIGLLSSSTRYMTINSFVDLCNSCKGIIDDNHDSDNELIIGNKCNGYLQHYICGGREFGQMGM
jgi:hypothetical protein